MGLRPMKVSRLILSAAVAGCGSVSVVGAPADGGIKATDGAADAESHVDAASDAAIVDWTPDTGAGQPPLACSMSFAAYCCAPGGIPCLGNWNSEIVCEPTTDGEEIVPDCDGFHAVRFDVPDEYLLFTASTGAPAATLYQDTAVDWSCTVGPPVFNIDAGCLSFWASIPFFTSTIPCLDAGGREYFSCDAGAAPDDGSVEWDGPSGADAYPGD
jgi:hypothetical protein